MDMGNLSIDVELTCAPCYKEEEDGVRIIVGGDVEVELNAHDEDFNVPVVFHGNKPARAFVYNVLKKLRCGGFDVKAEILLL